MKKQAQKPRFWRELERYVYLRVQRIPIDWRWVGVGLVVTAGTTSILSGYFNSPTLYASREAIIQEAASKGDYTLADKLYQENNELRIVNNVLGVNAELEDLVYPERKLQREIEEGEERLAKYPSHRDILLTLTLLFRHAGEVERAQEYYEQAQILDPNSEIVKEVGRN